MRYFLCIALFLSGVVFPSHLQADDLVAKVRKAVERSTLDQPGTKPFHLKAAIAPSFERDNGSNRTGTAEIWWESPTKWRREVTSPQFHQVAIVHDGKEWQKNDGDYFPEWLREITVALVNPVPPFQHVLDEVKAADVKSMMGQVHASWVIVGSDGAVSKGIGAGIALDSSTGLIFYGGEVGWGGLYADYRSFHNREVARKVSSGSPEATAIVTVLEDLPAEPPEFFNASQSGGDAVQFQTIVAEELEVRKSLLSPGEIAWPPLENGPVEGVMIAEVDIDRSGRVRDAGTPVSDNPGLNDAAREAIAKMTFKPQLSDGSPVQVVTTITLPFKTARPSGTESLNSARAYFGEGRKIGFPTAVLTAPYLLKAEFVAMGSAQKVETGRYEDTWVSETRWRREAWFGESHLVRSQEGDKRYLLAEGPDDGLLKFVLREMEPIPAIDTFVESDWRMKRELIDGEDTVRVLSGYESPEGKLDSAKARGYWFDSKGQLVQTFLSGMRARRSNLADFNSLRIAKQIDVSRDGVAAMHIKVTSVDPVPMPSADGVFKIKGHEYKRSFTDEVR